MRCGRNFRRFAHKYFGGTKLFFLWCLITVSFIYGIDKLFFAKLRDQTYSKNIPDLVKDVDSLVPNAASDKSNRADEKPGKEYQDPIKPHDGPPGPKQVEPSNEENPIREKVEVAAPKKDVSEKKAAKKLEDDKPKCGLNKACPADHYAYQLKSGVGRDSSPVICFDDNYILSADKRKGSRGLNVIILNDETLNVEDIITFDVYQDDGELVNYFRSKVDDKRIILLATLDEASYRLTDEGRKLIGTCGSSAINDLKFRDNFVMIGQKGLKAGAAVEKLLPRETGLEFGQAVEMSGCVKFPLGELSAVNGGLKLGQESENCGVPQECGKDAFSAHLFTGDRNVATPKMCINGKYVMAAGLNEAGRGLNIAVINPKVKEVIRIGHFDTFGSDSSNLEIFLEMLNDGEIVVVVSHDEASTKLTDLTRHLFNELGSAFIQNVKFRDVWAFIGYKGIKGFTDIEQIEYAGGSWPKPIDKRLCVPTTMVGKKIQPDPLSSKNMKRRNFCTKFDGYGDFCDGTKVDEMLTPAPLSDKTLEDNAIFQVPIAVIPGLNFNALRMQLETLIMNPGIQPAMVTVFHSDQSEELSQLAELFNFKTSKLASSSKYSQLMLAAITNIWSQYPNAAHIIVLEEEVIPSHDFLEFLSQCLPALAADTSLIGVSSWNVNGYDKVSTISDIAYRVESFPGLGFLLKKAFYETAMKGKLNECCSNRAWDGWFTGKLENHEIIVPDVSRVYRRPYEGLSEQMELLNRLFNRRRTTHIDSTSKLRNAHMLTKVEYEEELNNLIKSSSPLITANVKDCFAGNGLGFYISEMPGNVYSVYYEQQDANDQRIVSLLCKCFQLFYVKDLPIRGLHRGLMRFSYQGNMVFLVGSKTDYYKHKPADSMPVHLADLALVKVR